MMVGSINGNSIGNSIGNKTPSINSSGCRFMLSLSATSDSIPILCCNDPINYSLCCWLLLEDPDQQVICTKARVQQYQEGLVRDGGCKGNQLDLYYLPVAYPLQTSPSICRKSILI
jgi:hypothetical protein